MRSSVALLLGGFAALGAAGAHAAPQTVPVTALGQTSEPVALDGDLSAPAWRGAPSITLVQQNPSPGKPTPFATTVRLLRDRSHLYLGIRCTDPQPEKIEVHTLQRDGDQANDDSLTVILDTFAQKKLAYVFQVNARGGRADGVLSPGYVNPNTGSPIDYSWNGYWRAVVKRDAGGWTAQIEIDARSLQFSGGRAAWGLNVSRYVPRALLTLAWSGISLDAQATDLQRGAVDGNLGTQTGFGLRVRPLRRRPIRRRTRCLGQRRIRRQVQPDSTTRRSLHLPSGFLGRADQSSERHRLAIRAVRA